MITVDELAFLTGFAYILALSAIVAFFILEHQFVKHLDKHKQEKEKVDAEKHDLELLNKAREVVFDDLCNYFNSVKGDNNEI